MEGRFCRALRPTRVPSRARAPARLGRGPGVRRKTARPALFLWWGRSAWCVPAERGGAPRRGGGSMRKQRKPALRVTPGRWEGLLSCGRCDAETAGPGIVYGRRKIRLRPSSKSRKAGPYTAPDGDGQRPVDSTRRFRVCLLSKFPKREEKKRWENQVEAKAAGAVRGVVRAGTGPQPRAIRRAAGAATLLPKGPNVGGLVVMT